MNKAIITLLLLTTTTLFSQTPSKPAQKPAATLLPSEADIDIALKRTLGYDPAISWQVIEVRPSVIPGVSDVVISINKQNFQHMYVSPDGQNAIIGEMIPFGPNPFAPARSKLQAADGPSLGPAKGSINIVEFSDLECPHCKAAHPIIEKLAADFPQVRIIFQQFPLPKTLHPWAGKAATYADCAGHVNNDVFWKFIGSIFDNQGAIAEATADDKLKELATAAGLDAQKISACAATPETEARVQKSMDLGNILEVSSTPTVFINGRRIQAIANIPYDQLKVLVQFEIDHAGQ